MKPLARSLSLSLCFALGASVNACTNASDEPDDAASDQAGLTAGRLDSVFHVALDETFLGATGAKLLFLGSDAGGVYVARRTSSLSLDSSYGKAGRVHVSAVPRAGGDNSPPQAWVSAATALPDGRVVVTGAREGRGDYVSYGAYKHEAKLTLGVVSADGGTSAIDVVDLPAYPDSGCSLLAHEGGLVHLLAGGGLAVGASATCYSTSNAVARLYHFQASGAGFVLDRLFWQSATRTSSYAATAPVTSVVEGAPGKLLLGASGHAIAPAGNVRASLPERGYEATTLANPNPTAFRAVPARTVGAIASGQSQSAAARAADGSLLVVGASDASRCLGLQHTSVAPDVDLAFGAPALPVACVKGSSSTESPVALLPGAAGRFLLVTEATTAVFPPPGSHAAIVDTVTTRIRSIDAAGNVDASFGTAGLVDIANPRHPNGVLAASGRGAFVASGYLYVQLHDDMVVTPNGGGHVVRVKL